MASLSYRHHSQALSLYPSSLHSHCTRTGKHSVFLYTHSVLSIEMYVQNICKSFWLYFVGNVNVLWSWCVLSLRHSTLKAYPPDPLNRYFILYKCLLSLFHSLLWVLHDSHSQTHWRSTGYIVGHGIWQIVRLYNRAIDSLRDSGVQQFCAKTTFCSILYIFP